MTQCDSRYGYGMSSVGGGFKLDYMCAVIQRINPLSDTGMPEASTLSAIYVILLLQSCCMLALLPSTRSILSYVFHAFH